MITNFLNMPLWIFLLGALIFFGILIGLTVQKNPKRSSVMARLSSIASGILVSLVTVFLMLGIGEIYYRFFHADSGWGFTLAHKNWESRCWHLNEAGFRDREWQSSDFEGRTNIAVVGDSFASGWGVCNPEDRFGDVLAAELGDDYTVTNLGRPGTSTPQQLELLKSAPTTPDIVILQYFLNDIELASASVSRMWVDEFVTPPDAGSIAAETYLGNFAYWAIYPLTRTVNATFEGSYWEWEYATYDNFEIWQIHERELNDFIDYVESIDARLYVVIFPNMQDPVTSVPYVDRVRFVFENRGYTENIMTLYDEVAEWDYSQPLVVSQHDAHPSAAFHRFVGELIFERWFEQ